MVQTHPADTEEMFIKNKDVTRIYIITPYNYMFIILCNILHLFPFKKNGKYEAVHPKAPG